MEKNPENRSHEGAVSWSYLTRLDFIFGFFQFQQIYQKMASNVDREKVK
jgi:hypothetical protein